MTSVPRVLLDLSANAPDRQLQSAFNEADRRDLLKLDQVMQCVPHLRGRKGAGRFLLLVNKWHPLTALTRSDLEVLFLNICRANFLPEPLVNFRLLGEEVDCFWPDQRLVVELDSFRYHRGQMHFEKDMKKDNLLESGGYSVIHFSEYMLTYEAESVADLLKAKLKATPAPEVGAVATA